ncbi:MAG: gliding motility-associated-like protein [Arenicella sp.]|jgi:gliding motility-associated-like protein
MKQLLLTISILGMTSQLFAQNTCAVKINEVLYGPAGGGATQMTREYVELINYSSTPIDVAGWHIASDKNNDLSNPIMASDAIVSWQTRNGTVQPVDATPGSLQINTTVIPAGGIAVVLDPTWNATTDYLFDIPDNCIILTLSTFLNFGGNTNTVGAGSNTVLFNPQDAVLLYDADPNSGGSMMDSLSWVGLMEGAQNYSLQRDNDCEVRWFNGHPSANPVVATIEVDTDMSISDSSSIGLPNYSTIALPFELIASEVGICAGESIDFAVNATPTCFVNSVNYTFDDVASGSFNSADSALTNHLFQTSGIYNIQCIIYKNCLANDTLNLQIEVSDYPTIDAGNDLNLCEIDEVLLTAVNPDNAFVSWSQGVIDGLGFYQTVGATNYVVIADNNGCLTSDEVLVTVTESPIVSAGLDAIICIGDSYTFTANNPTLDDISWNNNIIDGVLFNPAQGALTYNVTASNGTCSTIDEVLLDVKPLPNVSFMADTLFGCAPFSVNFINSSSATSTNCIWDFGNGTLFNSCDNVSAVYEEGLFDVSLTVTDSFGCVNTQLVTDYIDVIGFPEASFSVISTHLNADETYVDFENTSMDAITFEWNFGDNSGISFEEHPSHTFPTEVNQEYTVNLLVTNEAGCPDETELTFIVEDELIFFVPNGFTPDGNGFNEDFQAVFTSGYDPYDYHMIIFDRWGEIVFESYDVTGGWNGAYGSGGIAEDGIYIWRIDFKESMSDKRHQESGHVTLLR